MIISMNGNALPSRMGTSRLSSSTMALSTPMPMKADSRCSVVEMSTPFFIRAGGVADLGNVAADGFHFEAIEVGAAEDNARARRGRQDSQMNRGSAMQSNATAFGGLPNCSFVNQRWETSSSANIRLQAEEELTVWYFRHSRAAHATFPARFRVSFCKQRDCSERQCTARIGSINMQPGADPSPTASSNSKFSFKFLLPSNSRSATVPARKRNLPCLRRLESCTSRPSPLCTVWRPSLPARC